MFSFYGAGSSEVGWTGGDLGEFFGGRKVKAKNTNFIARIKL